GAVQAARADAGGAGVRRGADVPLHLLAHRDGGRSVRAAGGEQRALERRPGRRAALAHHHRRVHLAGRPMSQPNRFDRRKFLTGMGGAVLALPMLQELCARGAYGQSATPPKRLLIIYHQDGRLAGDGLSSGGMLNDWWSRAPGKLSTTAA